MKSQATELNGCQKALPRQYPTVAELDVMLLFIKTFKVRDIKIRI